ncbi:uncharacterized protein L969DRAFT_48707 [Mixia osmundae IAM 14324]|uniref:Uncharacterized protein n=1 Tax=Mixia osmundae (strain CBS 9802 / IAM 14324 / JCM 22182 / KY 12970) TaxID=764103 RepID=G7DZT7_MIXOS|nr:uncharacterized protein L969DRAFT_48707 [Mixia osmundae IAM 14324]KEI39243.1 hypothetical protein L969DRAFT_48707 [Mixia osmundae IAM 14324]GAA96097.1 hypothetical protein E5Q_02758 [Mixia osmundae IAM 14324]
MLLTNLLGTDTVHKDTGAATTSYASRVWRTSRELADVIPLCGGPRPISLSAVLLSRKELLRRRCLVCLYLLFLRHARTSARAAANPLTTPHLYDLTAC